MSSEVFREIEEKLNSHSYMSGIRRSLDRVKVTAEIFTPTALVIDLLKRLPEGSLDLNKKVLDPACGDGQFLAAVKWFRVIVFGVSEEEASATLFGIDIMRDNVDLCKKRLGGGTVLMGDALNPGRRLENQTDDEYKQINEILENETQPSLF